jgi:hypothetical protein
MAKAARSLTFSGAAEKIAGFDVDVGGVVTLHHADARVKALPGTANRRVRPRL